jgi:alpha-galactosidase
MLAIMVLYLPAAEVSLKLDGEAGCLLPSAFTVGQQRIKQKASPSTATERTPDGVRSNDTWTEHSLQVQRSCTALDGGGAWQVMHVAHTGTGATEPPPVLSAINVVDMFVPGSFELFYSIGSSGQPTDFAPMRVELKAGDSPSLSPLKLAPYGGRSSDQALPMFHFISKDTTAAKSFWIGIGWTGTWRLEVTPTNEGLLIQAGQNTTNLQLLPGEAFRTPSVLMLEYEGDEAAGFNRWRRLIREHFTPRQPGTKEPVILPTAVSFASIPFSDCNTSNQILGIENTARLLRSHGVDSWWIDAGWNGDFPAAVGNWTPNATRFPNGLGPVGTAAAKAGKFTSNL